MGREGGDNRRAGRSRQFHRRAFRINGLADKELSSGGSGDRESAVLRLDQAATDVDGGAGDFVDAEKFEGDTGSNDIGDGVRGPDLVEVNAIHGNAMSVSFGFAEFDEDGDSVLFGEG